MFELSPHIDKNKIFLVNLSEIEGRLDPHFYSPKFQNLINKFQTIKYTNLGSLVYFSNETWNQKDFFDNDFPYIEISEIDITSGEIGKIRFIPKSEAPSRAKRIVRKNDIIISTTRPHRGAISLISEKYDFHIASTGFSIIRSLKSNKITLKYLYFILRQNFTLLQMGQRSSGGNYPAITEDELKKILISLPSKETQQQIIELYETAYKAKQQKEAEAEHLLNSIEDYLLGELGITLPEKDNSLENRMFKVNFSEVTGGRFDPNHISKIEFINNKDWKYPKYRLKDLIIGNSQYGANEEAIDGNPETDIRYIRITDIDDFGLLKNSGWKTAKKIENQYFLNLNDILFARSGSVGKCYIHKETEKPAIFAGYLIRFVVNPNLILPDYLFFYCNSEIYKLWVDAIHRPAVQANINSEEYRSLIVPVPPIEKQNEIAGHIKKIREQAKQLKSEAKEVLEQAKQEVEKMILGE